MPIFFVTRFRLRRQETILSHYRPVREEDLPLRGPLRTVKECGKERVSVRAMPGASNAFCLITPGSSFTQSAAIMVRTSMPIRPSHCCPTQVTGRNERFIVGSSSYSSGLLGRSRRFEPRSGAVTSTVGVCRALFGAGVDSTSLSLTADAYATWRRWHCGVYCETRYTPPSFYCVDSDAIEPSSHRLALDLSRAFPAPPHRKGPDPGEKAAVFLD
ncbi:hypothetical protein B0H13DRAFT_1879755 [Mycena leptocephala]|nr:hypothetical protein B0H13DRAFT_1879755 [Mycena leptocephala]